MMFLNKYLKFNLTIFFVFLDSCSLNLKNPLDQFEFFSKKSSFKARDGNYFPSYIANFFQKSIQFEKDHPSLLIAKKDILVIDVRPLTKDQLKVNESNLSWSSDGIHLAYEILDQKKRHIKVKNLLGDFSKDLAVVPDIKEDFLSDMISKEVISYNAGLSWSSHSDKYAFMSNGGVGEYNIYIGSVGQKEYSIAKSPTKNGYATWNPVSSELAFVSARSGKGDIYLVDAKTEEIQRLTFSDKIDLFPCWFYDGSKIIFSSGSSINHDLWVIVKDENSGKWHKPFPVTNWEEDELKPMVSLDGKKIAFYASRKSSFASKDVIWDLVIVPYIEGKTWISEEIKRFIVAEDVVVDINTGPTWTSDSQKVFFVKNDFKNFNPIYAYDLKSMRLKKVETRTKMNRDLMLSRHGVLSFRAQEGVWDRVYLALTNQGEQFYLSEAF